MSKKGVDIRVGAQVACARARGATAADARRSRRRQRPRGRHACSAPPGARPTRPGSASRRVGVDARRATARSSSTSATAPACRASTRSATSSTASQLTPVALAEAMALVDDLFGGAERRVDYVHIPTAVFTHPNIGTDRPLRSRGARSASATIRIYRTEFKPLRHTLSGSGERTLDEARRRRRERPRRRPAHGRRRRRRDRSRASRWR